MTENEKAPLAAGTPSEANQEKLDQSQIYTEGGIESSVSAEAGGFSELVESAKGNAAEDPAVQDDISSGVFEFRGESSRSSLVKQLVSLVMSFKPKLFRDLETGEGYIAPYRDGTEVWMLDSRQVEHWLIRQWMGLGADPIGPETVKTALYNLEAFALEEIPLAVRVCWTAGVLWYDLGKEAVRIDGNGWTIESNPPVVFKRFSHHLPQVIPVREGDFSLIDKYLPMDPASDQSLLLKVWLLAGFSPDGPRPILDLAGESGSGKSTTQKLLKKILDPNRVQTVRRFRWDDLQQALAQTWAIFLDNMSGVRPELSDLLATAVTGDATYRRKLYTDQDSQLFTYRRLLCISGLTHSAEAEDLLQRTILIYLPGISGHARKDCWQPAKVGHFC